MASYGDYIPYATELAAGVVELANEAEALDANNNRVVLTPQRGAALVTYQTSGFVPDSRKITAGNGLTGGGNLAADRTINVGPGDGIKVTPSTVDVDASVVRTSGNQTIGGNKTFSSPVTVGAGTSSNHALRKSQIETLIANNTPTSTTYKNVKDFGAVGNGTTDDTAAVQAAVNSGGTIYFPTGRYLIKNTLTATKSVQLIGDGQSSIILFDGPGGNVGAVRFVVSERHQDDMKYKMTNIAVTSKLRAGRVHKYGVMIDYTGPATVVGGTNYLELDNVHIVSEIDTDSTQSWFERGLYIHNIGGVVANNLVISSFNVITEERSGTEGVTILNELAGHSVIRTFICTNIYIQRYNCCVKVQQRNSATNIESIYIVQGELVGYRGFEFDHGQATHLAGLHMDMQEIAYQNNCTGGINRIVGCDIRGGRTGSEGNANYLMKIASNKTTVTGCTIMADKSSEGAIQVGFAGFTCEGVTITGNFIGGRNVPNHRALEVNSGNRNITYGGNVYSGFPNRDALIVNAAGDELVVFGQRTGNTV